MAAIERLEREKRSLVDQLSKLTQENEALSHNLKGLKSIKDARDKQMEIQKLLETNLQTLESRCELLEMQNDNLRREKEQL